MDFSKVSYEIMKTVILAMFFMNYILTFIVDRILN